jgi:hypothetical protein
MPSFPDLLLCVLGTAPLLWAQATSRPTPPGKDRYTFTGQVFRIVSMVRYKGDFVSVEPDARFVVLVGDINPTSGVVPAQNERLAYAVHSPIKTFLLPEKKVLRRRYEFTLVRQGEYWDLQVRSIGKVSKVGSTTRPVDVRSR